MRNDGPKFTATCANPSMIFSFIITPPASAADGAVVGVVPDTESACALTCAVVTSAAVPLSAPCSALLNVCVSSVCTPWRRIRAPARWPPVPSCACNLRSRSTYALMPVTTATSMHAKTAKFTPACWLRAAGSQNVHSLENEREYPALKSQLAHIAPVYPTAHTWLALLSIEADMFVPVWGVSKPMSSGASTAAVSAPLPLSTDSDSSCGPISPVLALPTHALASGHLANTAVRVLALQCPGSVPIVPIVRPGWSHEPPGGHSVHLKSASPPVSPAGVESVRKYPRAHSQAWIDRAPGLPRVVENRGHARHLSR